MELNQTKEEYLGDQIKFARAMRRVQDQARREGKNPNFGELMKLAHAELERDYERNKAYAAQLPDDA